MTPVAPREEFVPAGTVIWQSDTAKSYCCENCRRWVRSQYEGEELPQIDCHGFMQGHTLRWEGA